MDDGGAAVINRGVTWSTVHNPAIGYVETIDGAGTGTFLSNLSGLSGSTTYYVRAYATNSAGTGYGNEVSFKSNEISLATLTTTNVTAITSTTALSGGKIPSDGGTKVTEWGVCWSTSQNPTIADQTIKITYGLDNFDNYVVTDTIFTSVLTGLIPNTTYFVKAYAINSLGIAYGNKVSFITSAISATGSINVNPILTYGSVLDINGNNYKTIQIGAQLWMAENLKTTKFNDGIPIPNVTDDIEWESLSTPGYCWYNNDEATYKGTYGALYNWYAVKTDKLCPTGWHAPSNDEWNTLITYLGGEVAAGVKVIETGSTHWLRTTAGATDETGFTGLPGGSRSAFDNFRGFVSLGYFGHWWTTTDYTPPYDALITQLPSMNDITGQMDFEAGFAAKKIGGASVRCLKN